MGESGSDGRHTGGQADNGSARSFPRPSARDLSIERGIRAVFRADRGWLGIYQVKFRLMLPGIDWTTYQLAWLRMLRRGELITSFDPATDQFPRYLHSGVMKHG